MKNNFMGHVQTHTHTHINISESDEDSGLEVLRRLVVIVMGEGKKTALRCHSSVLISELLNLN